MAGHKFVLDDVVVAYFAERTRRERENLLQIFHALAGTPYLKGEWLQKSKSGRQLQVRRFGRWLLRYWVDDPALEIRIVDVEKVFP